MTAGKQVLVVEDHPDSAELMRRLLLKEQCVVTLARSVAEACEHLRGAQFDLLISDIGLPDGSGLDVMEFASRNCSVQGIALSGYGTDEDLRRSRDAGFLYHLVKPISIQKLRDVLRKVLGPQEQGNGTPQSSQM